MLMEKIRRGVLQVSTDSGLCFVEPSFRERLHLLWTFRNFHVLSAEILTANERDFIHRLCRKSRLVKPNGHAEPFGCVIGTMELHPAVPKKAPQHIQVRAQKSSA